MEVHHRTKAQVRTYSHSQSNCYLIILRIASGCGAERHNGPSVYYLLRAVAKMNSLGAMITVSEAVEDSQRGRDKKSTVAMIYENASQEGRPRQVSSFEAHEQRQMTYEKKFEDDKIL